MAYVSTVRRGFGAAPQVASAVGTGASLASTVAAPAISSAIAAPAVLGSLAVPVIGAALAGVTLLVTKLIANSGCGPTCIQATDYANQAGTLLTQNAQAYFNLPIPRPQSAQQQALQNANALWNQLVSLCQVPALGNAGQRCITDRQEGACTWKVPASQTQPQFPGGPTAGQCFNWWNALIDPIQNDPNVVADAQSATAQAGSSSSSILGGISIPPALTTSYFGIPLWGWAAGAALLFFMMSGDR